MADYKEIQPLLNGMWNEVLSMYGIDVGNFRGLNTKNTPCPLCGGNDRAHWREQHGRIALFCRHCTDGSMKSPEDVIMEYSGVEFNVLVNELANFVNHVPQEIVKKVNTRTLAMPTINMPIDHRQDHELVERFIEQCEWCHSVRLLGKNAPNPQELPVKNEIDYWPMYNDKGVAVNLVKYADGQPRFIAGGMSYGCLYGIGNGKRHIITIDPIDGILCWYKTKATIHIAFTVENLRYCLAMRKDINPVVCLRDQELIDETKDYFECRLLTGDPYGEFLINKL